MWKYVCSGSMHLPYFFFSLLLARRSTTLKSEFGLKMEMAIQLWLPVQSQWRRFNPPTPERTFLGACPSLMIKQYFISLLGIDACGNLSQKSDIRKRCLHIKIQVFLHSRENLTHPQ